VDLSTAHQVADWAGGELIGSASVVAGPDVVTDSRQVTPGAVFVAIAGERVDGHDFVAGVASQGATVAIVERHVDAPIAQVVVADTIAGLTGVARGVVSAARTRGLSVIGVTGSSGKTSTKDLIAQVLAPAGPTIAPVGSFNNEIGLPLTACRVAADTQFLVSEMGARGLGHVAFLCTITPPSIGAVLNVGHAHLGEFGSQQVIAQAKGELVEALDAEGWAVLNADDPLVAAMASRTPARVAYYSELGEPAAGDRRVWASDVAADDLQRFSFTLHDGDASAPVRLQVLGRHNVSNALAAAAVGLCAGLTLDAVTAALSAATTRSKWRMQLDQRADGLAVLNDAYNANPDSMAAALAAVAQLRRPGGRVVAVLGDMLELGADADDAHVQIGRLAASLGVDELVAIGQHAEALVRGYGGFGRPARYWSDKELATADLMGRVTGDDVVLVKASRGIALETVASALLREGTR